MSQMSYPRSAGSYFYAADDVSGSLLTYSGGSGSGGSTTVGAFTVATVPQGSKSLFAKGKLVRDMGKTVVSSGRTFRKIQGVLPNLTGESPTNGIAGAAPPDTFPLSSGDAGYLTYYVETGYNGAGKNVSLVRYM